MAKKLRSSNIELYRIIMMLIIIAHHLVVNSGVTEAFSFKNVTGNMIFLYLFGFGGKPMIDGFLLITGYFSIKGKFTVEKALKVLAEIVFYKVGFYFLFCLLGLQTFDFQSFKETVFYVFYAGHTAFPATYFWLYLLTPFLNKLVDGLSKKNYQCLLGVLLMYFTIISTVIDTVDTFNELGWYVTVYFIGGYLRLYEPKFLNNSVKSGLLSLVSLLACYASILAIINDHIEGITKLSPFYYVQNAHKLLGVLLAITSFQFFRHLKVPTSRIVNTMASSIFGVLLIHGNGATMRKWLWRDFLDIKGHYEWEWLPLYSIVCVVAIFLVCTALDLIRIHLLEKPAFIVYRKIEEKFLAWWNNRKSISETETE